jgi:hypothetical protein
MADWQPGAGRGLMCAVASDEVHSAVRPEAPVAAGVTGPVIAGITGIRTGAGTTDVCPLPCRKSAGSHGPAMEELRVGTHFGDGPNHDLT